MLQRPVPVVVIVGAEVSRTLAYTLPGGPIKGKAHVVLAADPRHRLHLTKEDERKSNESGLVSVVIEILYSMEGGQTTLNNGPWVRRRRRKE